MRVLQSGTQIDTEAQTARFSVDLLTSTSTFLADTSSAQVPCTMPGSEEPIERAAAGRSSDTTRVGMMLSQQALPQKPPPCRPAASNFGPSLPARPGGASRAHLVSQQTRLREQRSDTQGNDLSATATLQSSGVHSPVSLSLLRFISSLKPSICPESGSAAGTEPGCGATAVFGCKTRPCSVGRYLSSCTSFQSPCRFGQFFDTAALQFCPLQVPSG